MVKIEIERKFLVANDGWKSAVESSVYLKDGLLMKSSTAKLRVRREPTKAVLTLKSPIVGLERREFEYEIPLADADLLLSDHCEGESVGKTRHFVQQETITWIVDVYDGILSGVVLAEVELEHARQKIELPDWVGMEVTGQLEYSKANVLIRAAQGSFHFRVD